MNFERDVNQELLENFQLLCRLISPSAASRDGSASPEREVDLSRLEEIIFKRIPEAMNRNAPPDYYELYMDFRAEYDKFRDYILYDQLIGKNVVALGGGFSSGKSTFLNALNGEPALPEGIEPTTAVPTYVVHGDYSVRAINIFDAKVTLQRLMDIQKIAHGFGRVEAGDRVLTDGTTLGHVLESIFLATPRQIYPNIAFLDTPGYSKPESAQYSSRTDEQIARQQLNTAGLILWFVNAGNGVITQNDIDFLRSLREDIPKLVILTRADRKRDQLKEIRAKVQETLALKGVGNCLGVYAYDRDCPEDYDMPRIRAFFEDWNRRTARPNFAINFKRLFIRCRKFFEDEKAKSGWQLEQLNHASLILSGDEKAAQILDRLIADCKLENLALAKTGEAVCQLQNLFFQEIKRVSDVVGICMPEPSEIDLLREDAQDPLSLLQDYNRSQGVKPNRQLRAILQNTLADTQSAFGRLAGGGEYHGELLRIMRTHCQVPREEVRFNSACLELPAYQALVRALSRAQE